MTPTRRRSGHRGPRGATNLDTPPPCAWCDAESAMAVIAIEEDEGHTAVIALGPACLRQLTALGLGIQSRAVEGRGG